MKNPNLIPKPFAQNGQKDAIPANHKSDLPSQKATWDTGFPQITMMPVTAGGLPPSGRDFNGILNQISENIVYLSQGGKFKYSQEYADSTGGYPKGAILQSDDETREFQSLVDNNKINFNKESSEKVSAAWKQVSTTQLLDELNKKLNRSDVVQSVGNSKSQVMSQNAVTDTLNTKQDKGDYATNTALNQVNDNANNRLEKAQNGADIPDKAAFVNNIGAFPKTGGIVNGEVHADRLTSQGRINIGFGDKLGLRDGGVDAASFKGNNIEIMSWNGIGLKNTQGDITNIYFNTRTGDVGMQGDITGPKWGGSLSDWIDRKIEAALPVGVPAPWPTETPPEGWLICNGDSFDTAKYPKLARAYPSGELPDLRGEFIRGWDAGRGVDAGRGIMTQQMDVLQRMTGTLESGNRIGMMTRPHASTGGVFTEGG